MSMQWKEEYATGLPKIDDQHRQLFKFVNDLEVLVADWPCHQDRLGSLLSFLDAYTRSHFVYEESCMYRMNCPSARDNREAHKRFLRFFGDWQEEYRKNGASGETLDELRMTLEDWLASHICKIDTRLKECAHTV